MVILKSKKRGYRPIECGEVGQVSSPLSQFSPTLMNSPTEFLLELGREDINLTIVFRV